MPPKQEIRIERDISEEKMLQLIHVSTGNTRLMIQFMYYLGIRVSECIIIHMKDITIGTLIKVKIKGKGNKVQPDHAPDRVYRVYIYKYMYIYILVYISIQ